MCLAIHSEAELKYLVPSACLSCSGDLTRTTILGCQVQLLHIIMSLALTLVQLYSLRRGGGGGGGAQGKLPP